MTQIPQTARISSVESLVWVNGVRKMLSPIFSLRSTLAILKAENIFIHFTTELTIHHFLILHMRLSTFLILGVWSSDLAHLGVSVAQLQSIRVRRSEVWLFMTQHLCPLLVTRSKKKNLSYVSIQNKWTIGNYSHIFSKIYRV